MDSKKDKTVKIKSSISKTRKIIAEKFRQLHENNVLTGKNLKEKYAQLTDKLQQLIEKKDEMKLQPQQQENEQNQEMDYEDEGDDGDESVDDVEEIVDEGDDDVFEMPPPPYPPPPIPPPRRRRLQRQNVRPPPTIPPRSRSRSPHLSTSTSPPPPLPTQSREKSRRFSLPQPVEPLELNENLKRPRSMTSSSESEVDAFNFNRYKSDPKLLRLSYDPISIDTGHDEISSEQINTTIKKESPEDGAWGGVENKALSYNDLRHGEYGDDDDAYVEFIRPNLSNSTEFITKSLNMNKKNRRSTSVIPHVQFGKIERKRVQDRKSYDDEIDSGFDILKSFNQLTEKKMDKMNDGDWTEKDENNYNNIVAILSTDDFNEQGKFVGSGEKRRKISLALSKFNKESIQKIKAREKSKDQSKKGCGLEKNFIPYSENIVYEYWDDPNELCERLKLLLASKSAGNTNHDQEINSIIEELKERNIIA